MYVPVVIALMLVFPLISIVATGILTDHSALGALGLFAALLLAICCFA
ncbi:MAG TPA: hypothetical protein VHW95_16120 [Steroidobacteraceae bacterium]|jgi:hypothetical protein|nr:hypothetical protein [Steroidobacteraceae bacterium]